MSKRKLPRQISVSTAPVAALGDAEYYDLEGTIRLLKKLRSISFLDGFELQLEPEWDKEDPPLTDSDLADWNKTPKYSADEIIRLVKEAALPILSIHASRDVGAYLCSGKRILEEKGKRLIRDALYAADALGSEVCVFHLWDTRAASFDPRRIAETFLDIADQFSMVKASIENVPTRLAGQTPFSLCEDFKHITLDIRWAMLYNELDRFTTISDRVCNVHLHARLVENRWALESAGSGFYEVLNKIRTQWGYDGLWTIEPRGINGSADLGRFVDAVKTIK